MSIDLSKYQPVTEAPVSNKDTEASSLLDFLQKDIQLFGTQWSMKKKEAFYTELEVLLKAGLDLKTALEMVVEGLDKQKDKDLILEIRDGVLNGQSFSEALESSNRFSSYEFFSIRIAEASGKLSAILAELGNYFGKNLQYQRLLISALSYPVLVIFVAVFVLLFLLQFLVPLFADIYSRLDQELPTVTLMIVNLSEWIQQYLPYVLLSIPIISALLFTQRKKSWFRKISAQLILRLPIFGPLIQQIYLARFAQAMSFLLQSKVPMLQAIDLVKKMVSFYPIEQSLEKVSQEILKGKALNASLKAFKIYPKRMIALLKVGEEANQLDNMFGKLAAQYNEAVEQRTKLLGSLIEPVLIVFLAVVVGLVLVSMYLPIFKLVTNFG